MYFPEQPPEQPQQYTPYIHPQKYTPYHHPTKNTPSSCSTKKVYCCSLVLIGMCIPIALSIIAYLGMFGKISNPVTSRIILGSGIGLSGGLALVSLKKLSEQTPENS